MRGMMVRYAHALYCDDIRNEVGGKLSYIGVYRSDLVVASEPPAVRPQLCIAVWVVSSIDDQIKQVTIRILHDSEELARLETREIEAPAKIVEIEAPAKIVEEKSVFVLGTQFAISPFVIQKEGKLRVLVQTEREELRAPGLLLRFAPEKKAPET